jgi:hypothetical protein
MTEPRRPLELYGYPTDEPAPPETDHCPFLNGKCVKQRKSESSQTIGSCIVGHGGKPQLICPIRMRATTQIFHDVAHLLEGDVQKVIVIPEINIQGFGNVDFTIAGLDRKGRPVDFFGLEFQTNDTTNSGGIWDARQDFFAGALDENYSYGLNWKMTAKLVLKQALDKASVFSKWNKKYVWAMQDTLLARLGTYADMTDFHPEKDGDDVFFYGYEVYRGKKRYEMRLADRVGSNIEGVAKANAPRDVTEHVLGTFEAVVSREARKPKRSFMLEDAS